MLTFGMRLRRGELRPSRSPLQKLLRPPGRQTNQALLIVLLFAFGTGVATVAIGSPDGAWVAIGHGICGMAVVLLIPWKSRVVRGGLRRARLSRWLSLLLAASASGGAGPISRAGRCCVPVCWLWARPGSMPAARPRSAC